jgi:DNA replication and repair protein RecF
MGFKSLALHDFRNFKDAQVSLLSSRVFFIGENGQGKTNIIEAVYLLCYGSSFRVWQDGLLINNMSSQAFITGDFIEQDNSERKVSVRLSRNKAKDIIVDGKKIKDRKELVQNIPCVVFSHNDMQIVTGSPSLQRRFFNQTLCIYDVVFIDTLRRYQKILQHRNQMIKEKTADILDVYNRKLAQYGMEIQQKRKDITGSFNSIFSELFSSISGFKEKLFIHYAPSWKGCETEEHAVGVLKRTRQRDLVWKTTTTGPHRDRFFFYLGDKDFLKVASTGQLRLISIILKAAQARFYTMITGKKPLLLLDDVLLEIDKRKRETIISLLPAYDQAFFSFLPDEDFASYEKTGTLKYLIRNGTFQEWNEPVIF